MKKGILITAAALVICALVVFFVLLPGSPEPAYITAASVKTSSLVSDIDYSGIITAKQNVPVTSDTGGRVLKVNAALGQTVSEGDVLFTVDSTDIQLQYNQAEAAYAAAAANYEKITGGSIKQSEMQLNSTLVRAQNEYNDASDAFAIAQEQYNSNTTIAAAQAAYDMAKADYDRISALVSIGQESAYSLSTSKSKMDSAAAQLAVAKSSAQSAYNSAQSRLKNAQVALDNAKKDFSLTTGTVNPENVKGAQAQLNSIALVPGLICTTRSGKNVALVTIEQRQRHRQAHSVDPLSHRAVVLATYTDSKVRDTLSFL
jgi:multidrug efflux pump subunit AcrA (membrane-fusion protein)